MYRFSNGRIRTSFGVIPGSMVMALSLFMVLIGFNPQLAYGDYISAEDPGWQWVIPPGSWSGTLAERIQALGYEIVSLDLSSNIATVTFDDGRVLTVNRSTGAFTLHDNDQAEIMSGAGNASLVGGDLADVNVTYELADEPDVQHDFSGTMVADVTSNGQVNVEGTLDADAVDENVDLASLSYRPDGSTDTPQRELGQPRGAVAGDIVGDPAGARLGIGTILVIIAIVVVGIILIKSCYPLLKASQSRRTIPIPAQFGGIPW
ncbi:MAG: hypothetical protein V2A79_05885 [Planctomycetota bacterium]